MVKKYRKKPVVIEAVQWTNFNLQDVEDFVGKRLKGEPFSEAAWEVGKGTPYFSLLIETLEGTMKANPNDYIIKGVHGEFYPCKPDIFDKTYEEVTD